MYDACEDRRDTVLPMSERGPDVVVMCADDDMVVLVLIVLDMVVVAVACLASLAR